MSANGWMDGRYDRIDRSIKTVLPTLCFSLLAASKQARTHTLAISLARYLVTEMMMMMMMMIICTLWLYYYVFCLPMNDVGAAGASWKAMRYFQTDVTASWIAIWKRHNYAMTTGMLMGVRAGECQSRVSLSHTTLHLWTFEISCPITGEP